MSVVSTGALIDALRLHRILPQERLAEAARLAGHRLGDARELGRRLVQLGWLTVYQINEILAGRAPQLIVGPYLILERLGKGGLSQVFQARHLDNDWLVALKVLNPEALGDPTGRRQFLREMEAMAWLDHVNVVGFIDVDQAGTSFYFAMEYVAGIDLGKAVALSGPLPVRHACEYVRQAALGLQHALEHNLVHRDIKPVNLLLTHELVPGPPRPTGPRILTRRPLVKILDWGLADLRFPRHPRLAQALADLGSGLIGTPDYMAPEQARDCRSVDIRGDIYSLGCTLYFLLTGQPPFPDGKLMEKILQHQQAKPRPITDFRGDVPPDLRAIMERMMAKDPADRYRTPAAVALALGPHARAARDPAAVLQRQTPVPPPLGPDRTPLPRSLRQRAEEVSLRIIQATDDTAVPLVPPG